MSGEKSLFSGTDCHDDIILDERLPPHREPQISTIRDFFATMEDMSAWIDSMKMILLAQVAKSDDSGMCNIESKDF